MKKILTSLFIFIFIFSNAVVFAQMPVAAPGAVSSLEGLSRIGVVAAIQGKVEVMTPGAAGRVVQSGEEIFISDEVKTDTLGHLQILLLDETVFTIGPNSAITIDKFVYDPKTRVGNMEASITKGVFRYVSGKIAANKPENVTINLPTATIGIRGTIVAGEVSATGSIAMLLGPGSKNETGATIGSFVINGTGENSGQREHINRTGFGVSVDQTGSLSGVFMVPEVQVQHLGEALLPAQGRGPMPAGGENAQGTLPTGKTADQGPSGARLPNAPVPGTMSGAPATGSGPALPAPIKPPMMTTGVFGAGFNAGLVSGAQTFSSFQMMNQFNMMGMLQTGLMQDSTLAAQDAMKDSATKTSTQTVRDTLKSDMLNRIGPSATYEHYGAPIMFGGSQAFLNAKIIFDFTSHTLLGGPSETVVEIWQGGMVVDKVELTANQSSGAMDPNFAKFVLTGTALQQFGPSSYSPDNFNSVTLQFQDVVTQPADAALPPHVDIADQVKVIVDYGSPSEMGMMIVPENVPD
ncbi:MAG: FecR domain-containing protein [Candidatus Omnitrophota bacterium]